MLRRVERFYISWAVLASCATPLFAAGDATTVQSIAHEFVGKPLRIPFDLTLASTRRIPLYCFEKTGPSFIKKLAALSNKIEDAGPPQNGFGEEFEKTFVEKATDFLLPLLRNLDPAERIAFAAGMQTLFFSPTEKESVRRACELAALRASTLSEREFTQAVVKDAMEGTLSLRVTFLKTEMEKDHQGIATISRVPDFSILALSHLGRHLRHPSLTKEEKHAIEGYTGMSYSPINEFLRGTYIPGKTSGVAMSETDIKKNVAILDGIFKRHTLPGGITLFRGSHYTLSNEEKKQRSKIKWVGYSSTSLNPGIADRFANGGPDSIMDIIELPSDGYPGIFLPSASGSRFEWEVLLPRNTRLEVLEAGTNAFYGTVRRLRILPPSR